MPVLNKEQKVFVVRALAQFDTPTIVARKLKAVYDLDVPTAQIMLYNPTTHTGRTLTASLRLIFDDARKKYLDDEQNIGIANRTHRMTLCDEAANIARERGDTKGMLRAAAEAERIKGGYWIKDQSTGGGGPIVVFNAPAIADGVDAAAAINCNQLQSPDAVQSPVPVQSPGEGDA
ncbi:DUF2280 domain-containing protein [Caballeronia grimmiae]|uniref:DUF2280 domain-containing protein n=1 Tax=Caballeronia grimmiae TaxID=1071679 RepID=UPI0038B79D27